MAMLKSRLEQGLSTSGLAKYYGGGKNIFLKKEGNGSGSQFFLVHHQFKPGSLAEKWWENQRAALKTDKDLLARMHEQGFHLHACLPVASGGPIFCLWEGQHGKTMKDMQAYVDEFVPGPGLEEQSCVIFPIVSELLDKSVWTVGVLPHFPPPTTPRTVTGKTGGEGAGAKHEEGNGGSKMHEATPLHTSNPSPGPSTFYIVQHFFKPGQSEGFWEKVEKMTPVDAEDEAKNQEFMGFHSHGFWPTTTKVCGETEVVPCRHFTPNPNGHMDGPIFCLWEVQHGHTGRELKEMLDKEQPALVNHLYEIDASVTDLGFTPYWINILK